MAANAQKRDLCNRALMILNAGVRSTATTLFGTITDEQFADWTTITDTSQADVRLVCFLYERILKQVMLDIKPDFACEYADLVWPRKVNQQFGGWDYLFEFPSDFIGLVYQCEEGNPQIPATMDRDPEVMHFNGYSHVVAGSDDQAYYCTTTHTSADDSSDGQPPDDDGNSNWTLYSDDGSLGATWAENLYYKYNSTGPMLATNYLSNKDGDAAYIRYLAYVQAGRSDQPQYYPEAFANAFATRLAAEMALDTKDYERRRRLLEEYEALAKPGAWSAQNLYKDRRRHLTVFERRTTG